METSISGSSFIVVVVVVVMSGLTSSATSWRELVEWFIIKAPLAITEEEEVEEELEAERKGLVEL